MTNKMQVCGTISCPLIALHVSSDIFAYHQKLLNCIFTSSGNIYARHCLPGRQWRTYVLPEAV